MARTTYQPSALDRQASSGAFFGFASIYVPCNETFSLFVVGIFLLLRNARVWRSHFSCCRSIAAPQRCEIVQRLPQRDTVLNIGKYLIKPLSSLLHCFVLFCIFHVRMHERCDKNDLWWCDCDERRHWPRFFYFLHCFFLFISRTHTSQFARMSSAAIVDVDC